MAPPPTGVAQMRKERTLTAGAGVQVTVFVAVRNQVLPLAGAVTASTGLASNWAWIARFTVTFVKV